MNAPALIIFTLAWTGLVALAAEGLAGPRSDPRFARAVWRGAALLMLSPWIAAAAKLAWPQALAAVPVFGPQMPALAAGEAAAAGQGASAGWALPGGHILAAWALGAGWSLRALCALRGQIRLQSLKRDAWIDRDPRLQRRLEEFAGRLGLGRPPETRRSPRAGSPFLSGLSRRRIYLPADLSDRQEIDCALAHECAHLKHGDLISRPLERIVADVLFFSPFAWLARRRLDHWREAACDARAVQVLGDHVVYARALTGSARRMCVVAPLPAASMLSGRRGGLRLRVQSILRPTRPPRPARVALAAGALALSTPIAVSQGLQAVDAPQVAFSSAVLSHPKAQISSGFGARGSAFSRGLAWHKGVDIAAPEGASVYAPASGRVVGSEYCDDYGEMIDLAVAENVVLRFAALSKRMVKIGDTVRAGQTIGRVGRTGKSTGPHLHFEYLVEDRAMDPEASGVVLIASQAAKAPPAIMQLTLDPEAVP